jgi:hypothetical protein
MVDITIMKMGIINGIIMVYKPTNTGWWFGTWLL